jgi:hypothetical protein
MFALKHLLLAAAGAHAQATLSQSSSSFQLWVYAPGLGGLPLFYADGMYLIENRHQVCSWQSLADDQ